jgi:HAD superfamily hydrolase (TIGR01509 family)
MNIPHAVVFDLGKVLLDFDYRIALRRILSHCKITLSELDVLINQSTLLLRYEAGLLTTQQFLAEVKEAAGFTADLAEFSELFGNIFSPIEPMIELHAELRVRGVPTYIFSNTNELAIRDIRGRFPFFQDFDGYVLSYEHGALKPDARIYEVVERVSGRRGAEILYLDDRPENVEGGATRGWRAILHEAPDKSRAAVRETGLLG